MAEGCLRSTLIAPCRRSILAMLAAGAFGPAFAQSGGRSLTFRSDSDLIRFSGTVNGNPVTILLDSGAGNNVIDRRFADRIGLTSSGESHLAQGMTGSQTVERSNPFRLSFGGINLNGPGALADLSALEQMGEPIFVIVGRSLFDAFGVEIDFAAHRLTMHLRNTFDVKGARRLQLRRLSGGTREIQITLEGKDPIWAEFDLGSNSALSVDRAYARTAGLLTGRPTSTWIGAGVGGITTHDVATVRSVSIADIDIAAAPLSAHADWRQDKGVQANIGFPLISRLGRIFIDYGNDALYVFPGGAMSAPFSKNRIGLALSPRSGGGWTVAHVARGSPGDLSGWKTGAEIIAINGDRTMDRNRRQSVANGSPGTEVSLTLVSGEVRKLVLKDYY